MNSYETFLVNIENHIAHIAFNRPNKANSLAQKGWEEMKALFEELDDNPEVRVIVLSGEGKHFCAGIDLALLMDVQKVQSIKCDGRKREALRKFIKGLQESITAIEKCRKPVLAAIHNGCIGGGVDIISACDMRYCTEDAYFTIKEIDMGLVADIGTLQRLPKLIPQGLVAELAFTGRKMLAGEALTSQLVNCIYGDKEKMIEEVMELAGMIAKKSPLVVRGIKQNILFTRDHTVHDSLEYVTTWNAGLLLSNDLMEAFQSSMTKKEAEFEN